MSDDRPQRISSKPAPFLTKVTEPFWSACIRDELVIPECASCGHRFFYPRLLCPRCLGEDFKWIECSGLGTVWSTTTVRMSFWGDAFAADVPYNVSWIMLDEGVKIVSNVIGQDVDKVRIGLKVRVEFEQREAFKIPVFRPVGDSSWTNAELLTSLVQHTPS